jgi:hypothetical protein
MMQYDKKRQSDFQDQFGSGYYDAITTHLGAVVGHIPPECTKKGPLDLLEGRERVGQRRMAIWIYPEENEEGLFDRIFCS